ncbi:MAG: hypothetical protein COV34_00845 [Candidatus Zambryskibacteria bacterium CG10_big_fil_rev_8_21_14_0_10_42_12]|uniref:Fido domain-containing protein n=1 Tax=Candidatus Zambryskibacteria bacterium CG10_big_fil_rev_8_21_14_0_10_42_12 TaxID=1975115 RepID=A0A2H0QWG0_9BACT|nr:MAG: hypothetical protein COV34_00845 [Candidatus Zambryskibacteria bacterium CG10_big_fil_rev_8_21_14_0_10_42_12]
MYSKLCEQESIRFPLYEKQRKAIDAVVKTVEGSWFGVTRFSASEEKAVAYLCFIIKDHPVTDGNKRLALLWFKIYCEVFELRPQEPEYGYDALAVGIEKTKLEMDSLLEAVKLILFGKVDMYT